jgi:hypothetical protein
MDALQKSHISHLTKQSVSVIDTCAYVYVFPGDSPPFTACASNNVHIHMYTLTTTRKDYLYSVQRVGLQNCTHSVHSKVQLQGRNQALAGLSVCARYNGSSILSVRIVRTWYKLMDWTTRYGVRIVHMKKHTYYVLRTQYGGPRQKSCVENDRDTKIECTLYVSAK